MYTAKLLEFCYIHKSEPANVITNYQPIGILSSFSKIFEMLRYECLYKSLISRTHYGFVEKRPTASKLVCLTQFTSNVLDKHREVTGCRLHGFSDSFR